MARLDILAGLLILLMLAQPGGLRADVRMRLLSPAYGAAQIRFSSDNGSQYDLRQTSVAADILGLEGRYERFPWLGLGTAIFVRYDSADLNSSQQSGSSSAGSVVLKSASYSMASLAACLMLDIYPFPKAEPIEPFLEVRGEVYQFSENTLADPSVDRYRAIFALGMRSQPNETGYFWGARVTAGQRGYSGTLGGVAIPDPYVFGLQVDWIGLLL